MFVNEGDIVGSSIVFCTQENTGLVSSSKSESDVTYDSHIHLEITDCNWDVCSFKKVCNR